MSVHYFLFSDGEYSDYCVKGLFVTDHEVVEQEWQEFYKQHSVVAKAKREAAIIEYGRTSGTGHNRDWGFDGMLHISYAGPPRGWYQSVEKTILRHLA